MYAGEIVERGPSEDLTQRPRTPTPSCCSPPRPIPTASGAPVDERLARGARAGGERALDHGRLPLQPRAARSRTIAAGLQSPPLLPINPQRAAACWRLDVAAPDLSSGDARRGAWHCNEHLGAIDQSPAPTSTLHAPGPHTTARASHARSQRHYIHAEERYMTQWNRNRRRRKLRLALAIVAAAVCSGAARGTVAPARRAHRSAHAHPRGERSV